jgi:hypothetical protein
MTLNLSLHPNPTPISLSSLLVTLGLPSPIHLFLLMKQVHSKRHDSSRVQHLRGREEALEVRERSSEWEEQRE